MDEKFRNLVLWVSFFDISDHFHLSRISFSKLELFTTAQLNFFPTKKKKNPENIMNILFFTTEYEILQIKPHSRTIRTCHFLKLLLDFKIVVDHNWIEQTAVDHNWVGKIAVDHYSVQIAVAQTVEVQSRFVDQLSNRNDRYILL